MGYIQDDPDENLFSKGLLKGNRDFNKVLVLMKDKFSCLCCSLDLSVNILMERTIGKNRKDYEGSRGVW